MRKKGDKLEQPKPCEEPQETMVFQRQGGRMLMRWQPGVSREQVRGGLPGRVVNATDRLLEAFHVISNLLFQRSCLDEINVAPQQKI